MPEDTYRMWTDKASSMTAAIQDATDEIQKVEDKLDLTHRMVRAQRFMMAALLGILMLTLALALWNRATFNAVKSCTTPNGACHKQAGKDTQAALKHLDDESQRQHDQLLRELRTGTTSPSSTTTTSRSRRTSSSHPMATSSGTTTTTDPPPRSTTTTTKKPTSTTSCVTTPVSFKVCK